MPMLSMGRLCFFEDISGVMLNSNKQHCPIMVFTGSLRLDGFENKHEKRSIYCLDVKRGVKRVSDVDEEEDGTMNADEGAACDEEDVEEDAEEEHDGVVYHEGSPGIGDGRDG